ncbi:hypothetical protein B7Y94_05515, partial [Candidatus Saccharibacteria bacterium 32-49-12]
HLIKDANELITPVNDAKAGTEFRPLPKTRWPGSNYGSFQGIWYQATPTGAACPALIVKYGNNYGFWAPTKRDSLQNDGGSVQYRAILSAAGFEDVYGSCDGYTDSHSERVATEATITDLVYDGVDQYWKSNYLPCGNGGNKWVNNSFDGDGLYLMCLGSAIVGSPEDATPASLGVSDGSALTGENGSEVLKCNITGIGWILCPVIDFLSLIVDAAYAMVASLLTVQPLLTPSATGAPVSSTDIGDATTAYPAWQVMRNIANIAFVGVFLIIIFSQLTGLGVSNYGIKKMFPRLIIAAILVNLSYIICAVAIDLSNILGTSVTKLFTDVSTDIQSLRTDSGITEGTWSGSDWNFAKIAGALIAGTALTTAALAVGLSAFLPALLAALAAIVTVFLVLVLRQALIILLVVIAPLAFVAYLLPNTEDLFTKWRKLFMTLLLMFPIIGLVFGASSLASAIVMGSSNSIVVQVMGAAIAIVPLAITPIIMKTAGGVLNRFAGIVNNSEKGVFDRGRRSLETNHERRMNQRRADVLSGKRRSTAGVFIRRNARNELKNQQAKSAADLGAAAFGMTDDKAMELSKQIEGNQLAGSALKAANASRITQDLAQPDGTDVILEAMGPQVRQNPAVQNAVSSQSSKAVSDAIKEARLSMNFKPGDTGSVAKAFTSAVESGDTIRARALQGMLLDSGVPGIDAWKDSVSTLEAKNPSAIGGQMGESLRSHFISENIGVKEKDVSTLAWAVDKDRRAMASVKSDAKTFSKLSNEDFAKLGASSQLDALNANAITADKAKAILDTPELSNKISNSEVEAKLQTVRGGGRIEPVDIDIRADSGAADRPRPSVRPPDATPPSAPTPS